MWCQSSSNESTVVMNCSFLAIIAVMLKGAHALYSLPLEMVPLWNGVVWHQANLWPLQSMFQG